MYCKREEFSVMWNIQIQRWREKGGQLNKQVGKKTKK